jgi:flagellar biosynthesis/type III secretory pathway protein FliH
MRKPYIEDLAASLGVNRDTVEIIFNAGFDEGYKDGYKSGKEDGRFDMLLDFNNGIKELMDRELKNTDVVTMTKVINDRVED